MNQLQPRRGWYALAALLFTAAAGSAAAQASRIVVPSNTVVHVQLDERISSETAREGDRFTATVAPNDRSGLPVGTEFVGTITEVQSATRDQPGIIDMTFRRAVLPDGQEVSISGSLASLDADSVRRTDAGRLESRSRRERFDLKWVGYGAGVGAVLAAITGSSIFRGALLGGLGGAIYGYISRGRRDYREVDLAAGTDFGIRLRTDIAFQDRPAYRYMARTRIERQERVLGTRQELPGPQAMVMLNGRAVDLQNRSPVLVNDALYLPLRPVAASAGMRLEHERGRDFFALETDRGTARTSAGDPMVILPAGRTVRLQQAPILLDGEVYVTTEFLDRVADIRTRWDRTTNRVELTT